MIIDSLIYETVFLTSVSFKYKFYEHIKQVNGINTSLLLDLRKQQKMSTEMHMKLKPVIWIHTKFIIETRENK
jgi:hypothetical protein